MYFGAKGGCNHIVSLLGSRRAGTHDTSMPAALRGAVQEAKAACPRGIQAPTPRVTLMGAKMWTPPVSERVLEGQKAADPKIPAPTQTPSVRPGAQQDSLEPPKNIYIMENGNKVSLKNKKVVNPLKSWMYECTTWK